MQTFAKQKWPSLLTLLLNAQLTTLMQSIEKGTIFRSKPTFKGFVCHRLVQGVDTNIFDWFGKEECQGIICCQGKEGGGGATKR